MKGAAKCDKHCELQNSVNQQILERILRCRDIPDSMPASASEHFTSLASACELFARQRFPRVSLARRGETAAATPVACIGSSEALC